MFRGYSAVRCRLAARIPPPPAYPTRKFLTEMNNLNSQLEAPESQCSQLQSIIQDLDKHLLIRLGATRIAPFGSCSNGLWTRSSDVDLTMIIPRCNNKIKIINKLKAAKSILARAMKSSGDVELSIVENARIPVLKLKKTNSPEVDISVNNISGIENSLLVKTWYQMDPRFVSLARCIKHWAKQRGINDRSKGTLSTYTILLQIVYFLQNCEEPILAKFSTYGSPLTEDFNELNGIERDIPFSLSPDFTSANEESIHVLFRQFFEVFGDESFLAGVEIVDGEIVSRGSGVLVMRCPLTNKDVNVMNSSTWKVIHAEYKRARDLVRSGSTLDQLVSS